MCEHRANIEPIKNHNNNLNLKIMNNRHTFQLIQNNNDIQMKIMPLQISKDKGDDHNN
jgi:hypothetical protein